MPKSDPDAIFVGLNDRDKAWHDLYKVKISSGERALPRLEEHRAPHLVRLRHEGPAAARDPLRGERRHRGAARRSRATRSARSTAATCSRAAGRCTSTRTATASTWRRTGAPDVDLTRLTLLDVQTGKEELVEADPLKKVDLGGASFSDKTDDLIVTIYVDAKRRALLEGQGVRSRLQRFSRGSSRGGRLGLRHRRPTSGCSSSASRATSSRGRRTCSTATRRSSRCSTGFARSCRARRSRR